MQMLGLGSWHLNPHAKYFTFSVEGTDDESIGLTSRPTPPIILIAQV